VDAEFKKAMLKGILAAAPAIAEQSFKSDTEALDFLLAAFFPKIGEEYDAMLRCGSISISRSVIEPMAQTTGLEPFANMRYILSVAIDAYNAKKASDALSNGGVQ
jgi:hypothetical protein